MKCPLGCNHPATWHCYVVYGCDWLLDKIPESWPHQLSAPLYWVIIKVEERTADGEPTNGR